MQTTDSRTLLSQAQIEQFNDEGFIIVPNLLTEKEVDDFVNYEASQDPERRNHLDNHKINEHWANVAKHPHIVGSMMQVLKTKRPMIVAIASPRPRHCQHPLHLYHRSQHRPYCH